MRSRANLYCIQNCFGLCNLTKVSAAMEPWECAKMWQLVCNMKIFLNWFTLKSCSSIAFYLEVQFFGRVRASKIYGIWKIVSLIFCLKILKNEIVIKYIFSTILIIYKIPYRRAPRLAYRLQPLGRVRRASKGILHTKILRAISIF